MKKKIVLDIHTHTIASRHAFGTVRENTLGAKEKGLTGLGISDHSFPDGDPVFLPTFMPYRVISMG